MTTVFCHLSPCLLSFYKGFFSPNNKWLWYNKEKREMQPPCKWAVAGKNGKEHPAQDPGWQEEAFLSHCQAFYCRSNQLLSYLSDQTCLTSPFLIWPHLLFFHTVSLSVCLNSKYCRCKPTEPGADVSTKNTLNGWFTRFPNLPKKWLQVVHVDINVLKIKLTWWLEMRIFTLSFRDSLWSIWRRK